MPQSAAVGREGLRERNRQRRRQEFLDAALAIVTAEGLGNVTMQRVTQALGCAEGTIYQYFSSREALMAELQKASLDGLGYILLAAQQHLDELMVERKAPARVAALTRLYGAGRVWIEAELIIPKEIELCRRLFTHPGAFLPKADADTVLPIAISLLGHAGNLFDSAVAAGALRPGDGLERSVVILAGTTGILMSGDLRRWEPRLQESMPFAHRMFQDLLAAWGAKAKDLDAAVELVDELNRRGMLMPEVPRS
jgi:AcrR family transcriptional regulator